MSTHLDSKVVMRNPKHATPYVVESAVVKSGDTLSGMSQVMCGNPGDWPSLYQQNKSEISNPNLIYPGEVVHHPAACSSVGAPVVTESAYVPKHAAATSSSDGDSDSDSGGSSSNGYSGSHASVSSTTVNPANYSGFQQCVITRESGGQADIWNASGHWGLYQFSESTWIDAGGSASSFGNPNTTVAEQDAVFQRAYALWGTQPWQPSDGCS
jgi:hypothetical protein